MSRPAGRGIDFVVAGRRVASVDRALIDVHWRIEHLLTGTDPPLPPLKRGLDGHRLRSVPVERLGPVVALSGTGLQGRGTEYERHATDLSLGLDAYLARFSAKTRSTLLRKERRFRDAVGGLTVEHYRSPTEVARFLTLAAPLSALTYQDRLLDSGLPRGPAAEAELLALAARDRLWGFLLFAGERPVSYLLLPVTDMAVLYQYVGYDPALADLSPGTVLQLAAFRHLFADPPAPWIDFTEGEGAHKRLFATRSWTCATVPLLRRTVANRVLLRSSAAFDGAVEWIGRVAERAGVGAAVRRTLRR